MTFAIMVQNQDRNELDEARLEQAVTTVLSAHDSAEDSGLTIVITTNEAVQELNRTHRQIDAPTDVLSFPAEALPPELAGEEALYLGDLVIAYPYARAQAEREGHPLMDSLALLVVHGTLHLLGYDHDTPENRAEMWTAQAAALRELGIDEAIVPALEDAK